MKLPFRIDRNSAEPLIAQFAHGVARGIETSFWKPGEILPTLDEFAVAAGVSLIVVRLAIRRLVDEGLVNPRPGIGTVVLDRSVKLWRGHVVIVDFETRSNFFFSRVSGILRERLITENYLPSVVSVAAESYDRRPLAAILRQPISLAVMLGYGHGHDLQTAKQIAATGTPIITFSGRKRPLPTATAHLRLDDAAARSAFAEHCVRDGMCRVALVRLRPSQEYMAPEWLVSRGIDVNIWTIAPFDGMDPIENIQKGTMDFFERLLSKRKVPLPDVLFFDDDYAATAAIVSLLRHGVRIPEDIRLVSRVHRGNPPPFPLPLTRIEDDPFASGKRLADLVKMFLDGKAIPPVTEIPLSYIPGGTFPLLCSCPEA